MDDESSIEPITVLKTRSAQLVRRARQARKPILITQNGKATAVLQDIDSFREQRQALLLLRFMAQSDRELRGKKGMSATRTRARLRRKLAELTRG